MPIMVYTYLVWTSVLRSLYMNILRKVTATMQQCYFIDWEALGGPLCANLLAVKEWVGANQWVFYGVMRELFWVLSKLPLLWALKLLFRGNSGAVDWFQGTPLQAFFRGPWKWAKMGHFPEKMESDKNNCSIYRRNVFKTLFKREYFILFDISIFPSLFK